MEKIQLRAHAKINRFLKILGKRPDGYHMIRSAMQAINLYDDVAVTYSRDIQSALALTIHVSMSAESYVTDSIEDFIPNQEENIAYKAAALYCLMYNPDLTGAIDIRLHKRIPAAAGLAGGSADAAAVVLALDHLLTGGEYHTLEELAGFAAGLGADVPFCIASAAKNNPHLAYDLLYDDEYSIMTSSALCEGIGEIITPTPSAKGSVILIKPDIAISTPYIYELYDRNTDGRTEPSPLYFAPPDDLLTLWDENVLEPVSVSAFPAVGALISDVRRIATAASHVYMTGSGPTVVAVYPDTEDADDDGRARTKAETDADALRSKLKHRTDIRAVLISELL